jgi:SAM-dependent methyltransferase
MAAHYPREYSWREDLAATSRATLLVRRMERWYRRHLLADEVARVVRRTGCGRGRVLDVGCGTGDRLDLFRSLGFDVTGLEVDGRAAEHARARFGLEVVGSDLLDAHLPAGSFHLVTMHHVLEHLHRPREAIGECRRLLREGGSLVVQVPNMDSLQARAFGARWHAIDPPRHLYYFTPATLARMLGREGLRVEGVDHRTNWLHPPTIVSSLLPALDPQRSWLEERHRGASVAKRLAWIGCTLALSPLPVLEGMAGRGALVTAYARKGCPGPTS